ncbi:MAG: hypothetical protein FWF59_05320 [Turicibacter sp.]|nr:hypothetical protein [Turicibacter sp.]
MDPDKVAYIFEYPKKKVSFPYVSHMDENEMLDFGFKYAISGTIGDRETKTEFGHVLLADAATKQKYLEYLKNLKAKSDEIKASRNVTWRGGKDLTPQPNGR